MFKKIRLLFPAILVLSFAIIGHANENQFEFLGTAVLSGDQVDRSSETGVLSDGTPANLFGGISGLEYSGEGKMFFAVADRGPKDGAVDWQCRFHKVEVELKPDPDGFFSANVIESIVFSDLQDRRFTGHANAFTACEKQAGRFDPESIRVCENGNLIVSDEYGPQVIEFSPTGEEVKRHETPAKLLVKYPGIDKPSENLQNDCGRACNRGMEGITLSADGRYAFGIMQSALLQDSTRDELGNVSGRYCRLIKMDLQSNEHWEYVYELEDPAFKLHEILAVNESEFLIIENDGKAGAAMVCKKIVKIDLHDATDVKSISSIAGEFLPAEIKPVVKTTVIDLLDARCGIDRDQISAKIEGLSFGPIVDGVKTLVIATDNDFQPHEPTRFLLFKMRRAKP